MYDTLRWKEFQDIKTKSGQIGLNTDNEGLLQHLRFLSEEYRILRTDNISYMYTKMWYASEPSRLRFSL